MIDVDKVMKKNLVTGRASESVADVAKRMSEAKLGAILIVDDNGKLTAIFSERDLLNKVVAAAKDPHATLVGSVSTDNPITVPNTAHVRDCGKILSENHFRHVPIVDENHKPVGIISSRDFFQYMAKELEQVIYRHQDSGDVIDNGFDPYEYLGAGGFGLPHNA